MLTARASLKAVLDLQPQDHSVQLIYLTAHLSHNDLKLPPLALPSASVVRRRPLRRPRHPLVQRLHVLEKAPKVLRSFPQPRVPGADPPGRQPHPVGQELATAVRVRGLLLKSLKISTTAIREHRSILLRRAIRRHPVPQEHTLGRSRPSVHPTELSCVQNVQTANARPPGSMAAAGRHSAAALMGPHTYTGWRDVPPHRFPLAVTVLVCERLGGDGDANRGVSDADFFRFREPSFGLVLPSNCANALRAEPDLHEAVR